MQWNAAFLSVCKLLILEREMGLEPTTSSLGSWHSDVEDGMKELQEVL